MSEDELRAENQRLRAYEEEAERQFSEHADEWGRITAERDEARSRLAAAEARVEAVKATCDRHEHGALRWEEPLPVPSWIGEVRAALSVAPQPQPERSHLDGWAKGNLQFHLIWDHAALPTDVPYDADLNEIHRLAHESPVSDEPVPDLMQALRASVEAAKRRRG